MMMMTVAHHDHDADDVDADADDDDDDGGDHDEFFSLASCAAQGPAIASGAKTVRPPEAGPPREAGSLGHAFTMGAVGVHTCHRSGGAGSWRFSSQWPVALWIRCGASW